MTNARWLGLGFGILLVIAAFGLVAWQESVNPALGVALAQGGTTTPTIQATTVPTTTTTTSATPTAPQANNIGDNFWNLLAGKLGVNADDLKTKAVETRKEMIDQAVADGRATQAQGDAIKGRITSDNIIAPISLGGNATRPQQGQPFVVPSAPNRGPLIAPELFGGRLLPGSNLDLLEAVAKSLNLSPSQLVTELLQRKTLADIATAQNVDQATVKQAIIDARKAQIDRAVTFGLLTQAQADAQKAQLTPDNIDLSQSLFGRMNMFR